MVYFTCNACGQSLKKNQVENHYTNQCRRCEVLSCMDCGKNFEGDAYQKHVKCISEEEKYSGQNYKPKANSNKGEKKQLKWTETIQRVMSDVKNDSRLQELLSMLITFDNIPRKKQKFQKFVECSVNFKNRNLITKAWDLIESASKVNNNEVDQNGSGHKSEVTTIEPEEKLNEEIKDKKKKRKHNRDDTEDDTKQNGNNNEVDIKQDRNETKSKRKKLKNGIPDQNEDELKQDGNETKLKRKKRKNEIPDHNEDDAKQNGNETKSKKKKKCTDEIPTATDQETPLNDDSQQIPKKFKWRKAATSILRDVPENEMKIKKLKKKILAQYKTWNGDHMDCNNEEKLLEKIGKKLIHKKFQFDTENQKIKLMLQE